MLPEGFVLWARARRVLLAAALVHCVGPRRVSCRPQRVSLWARARRVSARLPSNFHLLAQMKVTKAKGLEHQPFELLASATRLLPRLWHENVQRTTLSVTSLTFGRSSSFRLDPAGPRRGGVPQWSQYQPVASQQAPAPGGISCAAGAAARAKPVAAHPLESSVALPMGRTRQSAFSRSEPAKWAGVRALFFGDFLLGQQKKVTRQPGRIPGGLSPREPPSRKARKSPTRPARNQAPSGSPSR